MLGWGLGGGDAETGEEKDWERVILGWDKTRTERRPRTEQCWSGDRDGAMAGSKRAAQRGSVGHCSPHLTAGGPRGPCVPGLAGCWGGAPYPEDGPGVEVPLIPVKEQKVVREEEDVDAQPGCLWGKAVAS